MTKAMWILVCLGTFQGLWAQDVSGDEELKELASWMKGLYSNEAQAKSDKAYFDLRLAIYPFWEERTDGFWFYVEQAVADRLSRPYRQEVYQLCRNEAGDAQLVVYQLREPRHFIGAHRVRNTPLTTLQMKGLIRREGCAVTLKRKGDQFTGQTAGKACANKLRRAKYMTWEVALGKNDIFSWDRGYRADDSQVWGNEKGGFQFKRIPIEQAGVVK